MQLQYLSDLHLERSHHFGGRWKIPSTDADVVVLAGDIDLGERGVEWAAQEAADLGKPVVYVPGNHEFWDGDYEAVRAALQAAAAGTDVHLLDNGRAVIDGVRFLGTTLWTDYAGGHQGLAQHALLAMNDHRRIRAPQWWASDLAPTALAWQFGGNFFTPEQSRELELEYRDHFIPATALTLHRRALEWLASELAQPFDGPTVVVSHHAPSWSSVRPLVYSEAAFQSRYWQPQHDDFLGLVRVAAYGSDLRSFLSRYSEQIDLWIHGHVHLPMDYVESGVRIVCNPRGYAQSRFTVDVMQRLGIRRSGQQPENGNDPERFEPGRRVALRCPGRR